MSDAATLQQQANAGDPAAQTQLAGMMLVGRGAPYAPAEAMRLLDSAAAKNNADALLLLGVLAARGEGRSQSWSDAIQFVDRAAQAGDARAQAQITLLGAPGQFDVAPWFAPAPMQAHCPPSRVFTMQNFLPRPVCDWLITRARPQLEAARVKNPLRGGANVDAIRTNSGMGFSVLDSDLVLELTHARIAAALGAPASHQEPTNILHYEVGEEYKPHFDFIDPGEARFQQELQRIGQRTVTFLVYLNDDYEGGATAFPRLDWSFKGQAGDALIFCNMLPDGRPDKQTLHAGTAPTRGVKWLLSKWVRDRPLPLI
ncbi:MAG: 2OG-Fe(II) oxygenase [Caulobacterales bacterium]|nr:2OG-Fe(II) oxygenase [Caulobacterales bacterium]